MAKKNSAGKYRGRVQIGVDQEGKPINKYVCASTLRELQNKKEEVRRRYIDGEPLRDDLPFYQYAEEWYRLKKEPFIAESSRAYYRSAFAKHILPAFGLRHMRAIRAQELQAFINTMLGASKSKITLMIGILRNVFGSAFADGIIERDPTVGLVRPKAHKKKERRALTPFETKSVLKTIETHEHGLLLAVLYYTGLRRGEALGLKWSDFDWDDNLVHVQRDVDYMTAKPKEGELKTQAADRYVPIPPALRKLLLPRREFGECYVFHTKDGSPLPQSSFQRIWLSLMMDAGCVVEREITADTNRARDVRKRYKATLTPHYFRHNYVTLLYEAGVDPLVAMKIVGHRDYQTTANIYTHLKEETLKKAAFDMDSVFSGKKISANMGKRF